MPTVDLPGGTVSYRAAGPEGSTAPPVVFVHGFLVNGELWTGVADALARHGVRSYAADWPLGSHATAMKPTADQTPRGVAGTIIAFLGALDLKDVTLVGNDTGGAVSQFLIDTDHARVGRLVLTNCDAFDTFPPPPFDLLFKAGRSATRLRALLAPMRATAVRHSPAGFGMLVDKPLDPEMSRRWVEPCLTDEAVRRDTARFLDAVKPAELLDVSSRLGRFDKPVLLVWGADDRFFKVELARRLAGRFSTRGSSRSRAGRPSCPSTSQTCSPTRSPASRATGRAPDRPPCAGPRRPPHAGALTGPPVSDRTGRRRHRGRQLRMSVAR